MTRAFGGGAVITCYFYDLVLAPLHVKLIVFNVCELLQSYLDFYGNALTVLRLQACCNNHIRDGLNEKVAKYLQ